MNWLRRLLSRLLSREGYGKFPVWAFPMLMLVFGPVAGAKSGSTPLTVTVSDSNASNWSDAASSYMGIAADGQAAFSDDNSGNWADGQNILLGYRETLADDANNLSDHATTLWLEYDVTVTETTNLNHWGDAVTTALYAALTQAKADSLNNWSDAANVVMSSPTGTTEQVADDLNNLTDHATTLWLEYDITVADATGLNNWADAVNTATQGAGNQWQVQSADTLSNWSELVTLGTGLQLGDINDGQSAAASPAWTLTYQGTFSENLNNWNDAISVTVQSTVNNLQVQVSDQASAWSDAASVQVQQFTLGLTGQVFDQSAAWTDSINIVLALVPINQQVFDDASGNWNDSIIVQMADVNLGQSLGDAFPSWNDATNITLFGDNPAFSANIFDSLNFWQDSINLVVGQVPVDQQVFDNAANWADAVNVVMQGQNPNYTIQVGDDLNNWQDAQTVGAGVPSLAFSDSMSNWGDAVNVVKSGSVSDDPTSKFVNRPPWVRFGGG